MTRNGGVADVTHDVVSVLEQRRTTDRFGEVEIELVTGDAAVLKLLGRELRDHGAKKHDGRAKIAHVLSAGCRRHGRQPTHRRRRTCRPCSRPNTGAWWPTIPA